MKTYRETFILDGVSGEKWIVCDAYQEAKEQSLWQKEILLSEGHTYKTITLREVASINKEYCSVTIGNKSMRKLVHRDDFGQRYVKHRGRRYYVA